MRGIKLAALSTLTALAFAVTSLAMAQAPTAGTEKQDPAVTKAKQENAAKLIKVEKKQEKETKAEEKKEAKNEAKKEASKKDVSVTLAATPELKTFTGYLEKTGLLAMLRNTGPYTVFAPSDEAFAKLPDAQKDSLEKNHARLLDVLKYHIIRGNEDSAALLKMTTIKTEDRRDIDVMNHGGKIMVGEAWVTKADLKCSNGVIHIIDTVLEPPAKAETSKAVPTEKSGSDKSEQKK